MIIILKIQLKRVIALKGTEIKSIRRGSANLKDSYAQVKRGEMFIIICTLHLMRKVTASIMTLYVLELLLHKKELLNLGNVREKIGYSLIPLKLYLKMVNVKSY